MTEAEWLACDDLDAKLRAVRKKTSLRKLRLFCCACCRDIWPLLPYQECRDAIALSEAYADGKVEKQTLRETLNLLNELFSQAAVDSNSEDETEGREAGFRAYCLAAAYDVASLPIIVRKVTAKVTGIAEEAGESRPTKGDLCRLLKDVVGPLPFRAAEVEPRWRTATVRRLAAAIYEERAFDRLPVLADALEDASCTDTEILGHCRSGGEHVRGCWVVDLILGKG